MTVDWDDESLDVVLRDVLQSQPDCPSIQDLPLLAIQRAQSRVAAAHRACPVPNVSFAGWHLAIASSTAAIVVLLGWFALSHLSLLGQDELPAGVVAVADGAAATGGPALLEMLALEETATAAIVVAMLAILGVTLAHAFTCDQGSTMELGSSALT